MSEGNERVAGAGLGSHRLCGGKCVGADVGTAESPVPPAAVPASSWYAGLRPSSGEVATAVRLVVVLLLAGVPLGVLWWAVTPRRAYEVTEQGAFALVPESEAAVAADGWFMLIMVVLAVAASAVAWRRRAERGSLVVVGLAVGMLLCGLLTWQLGALFGAGPSTAELAEVGAIVEGPLGLRAYGALLVGPFLAVAGYLLAVCFAASDDLRGAPRSVG